MSQPKYTTMPVQGGFLGKLGDTFLDGVGKYMDYRQFEKINELTGASQFDNLYAIEKGNQVNEVDAATRQEKSGSQWVSGVDNSVVILGGAGALALLLILTR